MAQFLTYEGLAHYDGKLKEVAGGSLVLDGRTIKLMAVSGKELGFVTIPDTTYDKASATADGLMSKEDFSKLAGIAAQATKVEESETNGNIKINGKEIVVFQLDSFTAHENGLYKITVDDKGRVTLANAVTKDDITGLGIPAQDTTYDLATAKKDGLLAKGDFTKLQNIAAGAQVNVLEKVSVNGSALPINSKGVNIDLTSYALKTDVASVYKFRGTVATYEDLPKISGEGVTPPAAGDTYSVSAEFTINGKSYPAETNVAFVPEVPASGEGDNATPAIPAHWDPLGGTFDVAAIPNSEIDKLFATAA